LTQVGRERSQDSSLPENSVPFRADGNVAFTVSTPVDDRVEFVEPFVKNALAYPPLTESDPSAGWKTYAMIGGALILFTFCISLVKTAEASPAKIEHL